MYKVIICGDRLWDDYATMEYEIRRLISQHGTNGLLIIEGGAAGADQMAGHIAHSLSVHVAEVKALWSTRQRGAGPQRNLAMLELGPDEVLAFHKDLPNSRGTAHMVRSSLKAGIPVQTFA